MIEGFNDGGVRIFEFGIFSAHGNGNFLIWIPDVVHQLFPFSEIRRAVYVEFLVNVFGQTFTFENDGDFIDVVHVQTGNDRLRLDIAEIGYLGLDFRCQKFRRPADDDIRENTPLLQKINALLSGFGFLFIDTCGNRHVGEVYKYNIVPSHILFHLAHGFQEELVFNISNGSTDFHNHQVRGFFLNNLPDVIFDQIRYVGDVLNGFTQVITASFLFPDHVENLAHGQIPVGLTSNTQETLIMSEIHIHLTPIIKHENFAVFKGIHGAGVHIKITVTFDGNNFEFGGEQVAH